MQGVLLDTSAAPPSTHWAVVALGVLTVVYIAFVRPLKKGRKKDPLARGPADAALAQQRAVERDMTTLLVEYEQVIRTMSAQLETRVTKLEVLLGEADAKLAALRAAERQWADRNVAGVDRGGALAGMTASRPPATSDDSGAGFEVPPELTLAPDVPPRHADVYALADEGLGYRQIARKLDRPYGEIELILALRPKPASPADPDGVDGHDSPPSRTEQPEPVGMAAAAAAGTDADRPVPSPKHRRRQR